MIQQQIRNNFYRIQNRINQHKSNTEYETIRFSKTYVAKVTVNSKK